MSLYVDTKEELYFIDGDSIERMSSNVEGLIYLTATEYIINLLDSSTLMEAVVYKHYGGDDFSVLTAHDKIHMFYKYMKSPGVCAAIKKLCRGTLLETTIERYSAFR